MKRVAGSEVKSFVGKDSTHTDGRVSGGGQVMGFHEREVFGAKVGVEGGGDGRVSWG